MPKLRFPEFQDAGAWKVQPLSEICNVNPSSTKLPESFFYIDLGSVVNGYLIAQKIIKKQDAPSRAQRLLKTGDIIFQIVRPYQRNNFFCNFNKENHYVASTGYAQLRAFESSPFLYHAIHTNDFVNRVISKCTGSNYPAINSSDLANVKLSIPDANEQQKIADCLFSINELITAEKKKLDVLKTYKKGLMQQLFPAEGETHPKLRFPEFQTASEWTEKYFYDLLDEVLDFRGRTPTKLGMAWGGGNVLSLSANNVKNGYIDFNTQCNLGSDDLHEKWMGKVELQKNDIVFTMEAPLGNALLLPDSQKYILSQRVVAFKTKKNIANSFLIQLIWSRNFQNKLSNLSTGSTAKGINQKALSKIKLRMPLMNEQQKIADCLSSIDELITAESKKLEVLKNHKKGLMQQLFPTMSEL